MAIWFRILLRDITKKDDGALEDRRRTKLDVEQDFCITTKVLHLDLEEVSNRILCWYFKHRMGASAINQVSTLAATLIS